MCYGGKFISCVGNSFLKLIIKYDYATTRNIDDLVLPLVGTFSCIQEVPHWFCTRAYPGATTPYTETSAYGEYFCVQCAPFNFVYMNYKLLRKAAQCMNGCQFKYAITRPSECNGHVKFGCSFQEIGNKHCNCVQNFSHFQLKLPHHLSR